MRGLLFRQAGLWKGNGIFCIAPSPFVCRLYSSAPAHAKRPLLRYRNIGIIAHVDAGKTTTVERMLYYSGVVNRIGEVHRGDTVMDYLKQERERGITITAAAITFNWNHHRLNLVDTPGHVDFTVEVERSVRVMDGAVAIFDALAGVQAQTVTVWNQADRYGVPRIAYLNKMDREGISVQETIDMIKGKLGAHTLLLQMPVGEAHTFAGMVDLVNMEVLVYSDVMGSEIRRVPVSEHGTVDADEMQEARNRLVEDTADKDEILMDKLIELSDPAKVTAEDLTQAIRRVTLAMKAVPVLLGSSLKNKGVQPLLDAVVSYLPSPIDRPPVMATFPNGKTTKIEPDEKGNLCALAFKVVHDAKRGLIVYCRVYSGTLKLIGGSNIYNVNTKTHEKVHRLAQMAAEDMIDITEVKTGDIAAVFGLKNTSTGDTLVSSPDWQPTLSGIVTPPPVFVCSVEPENASGYEPMLNALKIVQKEDPSFHCAPSTETGQFLLSGMGELHLDIISNRLSTHFKTPHKLGKMQVSYRGTITETTTATYKHSYSFSDNKQQASIRLELSPNERGSGNIFEVANKNELQEQLQMSDEKLSELVDCVKMGVEAAWQRGVPPGFVVDDMKVRLISVEWGTNSSAAAFKTAAMLAVSKLGMKSGPAVLEPIMALEISVDDHYVGAVLSDLNRRRAEIKEVETGRTATIIHAYAPLSELVGYATAVRSVSQGAASYSLEFSRFGLTPNNEQSRILKEHGIFIREEKKEEEED